jgi:hypothetical protein
MPGPVRRPLIDTTRPDRTRVLDYWLGGKDNFAADREAGEMLLDPRRGHPGLRAMARQNRRFILAAVTWAASRGIGQFLDLGCGLPTTPSVHDAARAVIPDAAVIYVDRDPLVMCHVAAIGAKGAGLAAVRADVTEPARVLEVAGDLIDLGQPACVIFGGTLSDMPADTARSTVAGFTKALAPGSAAVISCASFADEDLAERISSVFGPEGGWRNHGLADVTSFFTAGRLRLVHEYVMDVACWPACSVTGQARAAAVLGGVGIKG